MQYAEIMDHQGQAVILSKIILGTAVFGSAIPREKAFELMDLYYEYGGRGLDTARVYSDWLPGGADASERTVGEWIRERGCRDEIVLITKGAHPPMDDMHASRVTPEAIRADLAKSLEVLQTDYVDIYFLHRDDERMPVSVIMDVLDELVQAGKVRMLGASNWRAQRIMEANEYARANGKTPFSVSEIQWSYAVCTAKETFQDETLVCMDGEQMELYRQMKMPVLAFSSQANGVFSCGYREDLSDLAEKHRRFYSEENIRRYQALLKKCREEGCTPTQAALDYITKNETLSGFAIVGCSGKEQLLASLGEKEPMTENKVTDTKMTDEKMINEKMINEKMTEIKMPETETAGNVSKFDAAQFLNLLETGKKYMELMNKYRCAIMEVETKLKVLNSEFSLQYDRNPFESIKSRLKSPASIIKKLQKKELLMDEESFAKSIEDNLFDVAGIRVICAFQEDIYRLAHLLIQQDDVQLIRVKDYIKNPKPNGYRSLHLILEIPVFLQSGKTPVKVEVQFRTIAMDFWASVDHKLRYKKDVENEEEIVEKLRFCAETISGLDDEMQQIRCMIEGTDLTRIQKEL